MNTMNQDMIDTTNREIIITRVFDAPRKLLYKAWTDPTHVERWWGPKGFTTFDCVMDLRVGGVFRLQMRGPDGVIYPCRGIFREIDEPKRIVLLGTSDGAFGCGAGLPPRAVVTITFSEQRGKTTVTIRTLLASVADRDAAVDAGINPGWISTLERLAEALAEA